MGGRYRRSGRRRGGTRVGIHLSVLCALWTTAWAQNRGPVNIASRLPESAYHQSSFYHANIPAKNGANGDTGGTYYEDNCIYTSHYLPRSGYTTDRSPWWQVTLDRPNYIYHVRIWGRTGHLVRLYPFIITVDNSVCVSVGHNPGGREVTVNCTKPLYGQVVRLTHSSNNHDYTLNMCEFQILVCIPGFYGVDCNLQCSRYCSSQGCYMNNGTCISCGGRFWGDSCQNACGNCRENNCNINTGSCISCKPGWYGDQCLTQCPSPHCLNRTCDQGSGVCLACKGNFDGANCTDCTRHTYGQNCSQQCGWCKHNRYCDVKDGSCSNCQAGWQMPLCQEGCEDGSWGDGCSQQCGHCKDDSPCNKVNGYCGQCQPGWYPGYCKKPCPDGMYGVNCTQTCGDCSSGIVCNKTNGHCPCPLGKQPPLCNTDCQNQTYGQDCRETCGHCKEGSVCAATNGHCTKGCQPGWIDITGLPVHLCKTACPAGLYGDLCNQTCGHCQSSSTCHHVTGECLQGCEKGFAGVHCMKVVKDEILGLTTIIGIIVAVVVIIIVAVAICIVLRSQKRGRKAKGYRDVRGELSSSRDGLTDPPDPSILSTTSLSLPPPESDSEKPTSKPMVKIKPTQSSKNNGAIYENVSLTIQNSNPEVSSASSASTDKPGNKATTLPKLQAAGQYSEKGSNGTSGKETPPEAMTDDEADFEFDEEVYANTKPHEEEEEPPTGIQLDMLQEIVLDRLRSGQLDEEFLRMVPKKDHPTINGQRQENYYKNRFNSILPYDGNRVILAQVDGDDASDYVNASFIKGHKTARDYIAAQGPKVNTQYDWWRMIWQEGVTDIVMLTNVMEGIKPKCCEYWPASGDVINTGYMVVTGVEEHHRAHFVIREFDVKEADGQERRRVKQYHYLCWMDHEVPAPAPLVNFWRYISARAPRSVTASPLLVHCSAGVGRTGTYIALDIVLAHAREAATKVDIYDVVNGLRDDRCHMVQNKNQYAFLHEAVLEAYMSEDSRVKSQGNFDLLFPHTILRHVSNQRIDAEFQKLCKMRNNQASPSYIIGSKPENQAKNRNPHALPDDKHLVYLTQHVTGRNQYINAVYMPTFLQARGSITTQLPLPDTLVDVWRLIDGCDVSTVVSLGDVEGKTDMCRYWPRLGDCLKLGIYTISVQSVAQIGESLDSYILTMEKETNDETREIQVLHLKSWTNTGKESTSDLIHVLDILCKTCDTSFNPVVVQCIDGAEASGQFCALWEAVQRLKSDGEVDVYLAARQVTTVTRLAFTGLKEYRYCYEVVQNYTSAQNIYANA